MYIDEGLFAFATPRQQEVIQAINKHGGIRPAARALGLQSHGPVNKVVKSVKSKAARQGYSPDHDMTRTVPDGYLVKGVSTFYDKDGKPAGQWVKSQIDRDQQEQMMQAAYAGFADTLPQVQPVASPTCSDDKLMACYPVGDHHIGMLAWHEETGENYNIDRAETLLIGAMAQLVHSAPSCTKSTIAVLGDFLHYDSFDSVTPQHKNQLDSDSRYPEMVRSAIKCMRVLIDLALRKHETVKVIIEIGNHDLASSIFLSECLYHIYENEPRVTVDRSPSRFHYFRHGKCLVGIHHGDTVKADKLPLLMASDRPQDWGDTYHRYWWTGHVHHESKKDFNGVSVESFRILPPVDAYAASHGYRSARDMKAIILHDTHGEVARFSVNPAMVMK